MYLLNKNIAQLRWFCGLPTQDLRATLPNLFGLLQGTSDFRYERGDSGFSSIRQITSIPLDLRSQPKKYGSFSTLEPSLASSTDRIDVGHISNSLEQIFNKSPVRKISRNISETGPGLSQILSSPTGYFKNISNQKYRLGSSYDELIKNKNDSIDEDCDKIEIHEKKSDSVIACDCNIEQGLDMLDTIHNLICSSRENDPDSTKIIKEKRISRSVGSYTDDEKLENNLEIGSDPLLRNLNPDLSDNSLPNSLGEGRKEFLQHWFNNSSAHVCSDENLCPEFLGATDQSEGVQNENSLQVRTEALIQKNSTFHLVKPKH